MEVTIRMEEAKDMEEIDAVIRSDYVRDWKDEASGEWAMVKEIRESPYYIPQLAMVAVAGDRIAGHILFTKLTVVDDDDRSPALFMGPMSIHKEYQKKGIGTRLVEYGLREAASLGYESVFIQGHTEFYPGLGFSPVPGLIPYRNVHQPVYGIALNNRDIIATTGVMEGFQFSNDQKRG